jgi:hypothetical protein
MTRIGNPIVVSDRLVVFPARVVAPGAHHPDVSGTGMAVFTLRRESGTMKVAGVEWRPGTSLP